VFAQSRDGAIGVPGNVFKEFQWVAADGVAEQFGLGFEAFAARQLAKKGRRKEVE
jgi:hypothetical protein